MMAALQTGGKLIAGLKDMCAKLDARKAAIKGMLLGLFFFLACSMQAGLSPDQAAVMMWATITENPPKVTLHWNADPDARSYEISKKQYTQQTWSVVATVEGTVSQWTDTNVQTGVAYEYSIRKDTGIPQYGYGLVSAGIRLPMAESRGKLILLVEQSLANPLALGLARLQQDLVGDGWTVLRHDVSAADSVMSVKALIQADYQADPTNTKALFLFGHVPVAYSGYIAPDGHDDHRGAWPADVYYGEFDGAWTDNTVVATNTANPLNRNVPGDGKFDQSTPPGKVRLQIGRVDLSDLTCFANKRVPRYEVDLARQYLNKDHAFRHGELNVARQCLILNHWGGLEDEPHGSTALRAFPSMVGLSGMKYIWDDEFFPNTSTNSYLWGYVSSSGGMTFVNGVGSSDAFALNDPRVIFTSFMGSYFGDWDRESNFLRAALGTSTHLLTSLYGGQPQWILHPMAMGETIGQSALLTQNNGTNGIYLPHRNFGVGEVHISLLGDPTLRLHAMIPPSGFTAARNGRGMDLSWTASAEPGLLGYNIYRAASPNGPFTKISGATPINVTAFTDTSGSTNDLYMIRAVKLEQSFAGSYTNLSQGIFYPDAFESAAPLPPADVVVAGVTTAGVKLTWVDQTSAAQGFKIERRLLPSGTFQQIGVAPNYAGSYTDPSAPRAVVAYRVIAVGPDGDSDPSAEVSINLQTPFAVAVGLDVETGGNWSGKYGQEGYVVYDSGTNLPPFVTYTTQDAFSYVERWDSPDWSALMKPNGTNGLVAFRFNWQTYDLHFTFHDSTPHRVALYRQNEVTDSAEVFDPLTGKTLATIPFSAAPRGGYYLVFDVQNTVDIRLRTNPTNESPSAAINGVFFSSAGQLPAPVITPPSGSYSRSATINILGPAGADVRYTLDGSVPSETSIAYNGPFILATDATITARAFRQGFTASEAASVTLSNTFVTTAAFMREDTTTQGEWTNSYGQDGFWFGTSLKIPDYGQMSLNGAPNWLWSDTTTERRALNKNARTSGRLASAWYGDQITFDLDVNTDAPRAVALYFLDWDRLGRVQEITVTDLAGNVLDRRQVGNFGDGKYLVWKVVGSVRFTLKRIAGSNAIVNGIFIGPTSQGSIAPAQLATLILAGGGQYQIRVMGQAGQTFDVQYTTDLQTWTTFKRYTLNSTMADWTLPFSSQPGFRFYRAVLVQ